MASASLRAWMGSRAARLDEIEAAHGAVRRTTAGRRTATEQLNHAYAVLLCSQFQGYCRDLHSEAADRFVEALPDAPVAQVVRAALVLARRLDRGNPNPANLAADFHRLGIDLWQAVSRLDARSEVRRRRIAELTEWRNAIAHQDFANARLAQTRLQLSTVRAWRMACDALARSFDRVLRRYLESVTGIAPW